MRIESEHSSGSGVGADEIQHQFDEGAFPGAVRADEPADLTPLHGEIEVEQAVAATVVLGELPAFESVLGALSVFRLALRHGAALL